MIQLSEAKKIYGKGESAVHALSGISLNIQKGELSYEGLELINAKEAVVCAVKLTRAARGAAATAGK